MIDGLATQLLRRHVSDGADHGSMLGDCGKIFGRALFVRPGLKLGHAEVQNLEASVVGDEKVFGFQVAMNDGRSCAAVRP